MISSNAGKDAYSLAVKLWPICRSITGKGVRQTLSTIKDDLPGLEIRGVSTGTNVFDWTVPQEWRVKAGYILTPDGRRLADFEENNLHILGYSTPIDSTITLSELKEHVYTLPDQPALIPYVTSYYEKRWGFCLSHETLKTLPEGKYHVKIDSYLFDGCLNYADLVIPGETKEEVFFSSYVCHPSMANNELSGPCLMTQLAKYVTEIKRRKYTYRFVFVPETIGSITYLSLNLDNLKKNVVAGFNISCVGDNRTYSFLPSIKGNTLADRVALYALSIVNYDHYSFLTRGSDERQYCYPGIDLPVISIMRSKYGTYPEYHTSADNLSLISPEGLQGAFDIYCRCIQALESNKTLRNRVLCEPHLGKRGLYPTISTKTSAIQVEDMMNLLAYSDGNRDLLDISMVTGCDIQGLAKIGDTMIENELMEMIR